MIMVFKHDTVTEHTIVLGLSGLELIALRRFLSDGLRLLYKEDICRTFRNYQYPPPGLSNELANELLNKLGEIK